ncbi:hypothetical protein AMECASPLE_022132 [Ameca splendens]|uniref:Uncharacterized protein n=1 Tax=Ameca splendens TaxID=208324 RepID=A0ABV0XSM2_9TELE
MIQIRLEGCCCFLSQPHLTSPVAQVKVPHHDPDDAHQSEPPPHVLLGESVISCNLQLAHSESAFRFYRYLRLVYTAQRPPVPEHTPTRLPLSGWLHGCSEMISVRGAQCNFSGNEGGRSTWSKLLFWTSPEWSLSLAARIVAHSRCRECANSYFLPSPFNSLSG